MAGVYPDCRVEIAFSTNPTAIATWVDVTPWVQGFSIRRGRQRELNVIDTGTATVLLDNRDRRFDPTYTAGPYYPNVLPTRRIRISGIYNSITYPQFSGYIEAWPQTWNGVLDANVALTAADGFKVLTLAQLNTSFPQERSDIRIGNVLTSIGWSVGAQQWTLGDAVLGLLGSTTVLGPTGDRNLGVGYSLIQPSTLTQVSALQHMQDVTTTENGLLFMGKDGRVTFVGRSSIQAPSIATFGELELPYTDLVLQYDDSLIYNDVHMTSVGGTEQVSTDAASQASYFLRTITYTSTLHTDDMHANALGSYLLTRYKQPFLEVIRMTLDGTASPATMWPHILGREIGDCVTVNRRPPFRSNVTSQVISQLSVIQGMQIDYTAQGGDWTASWELLASDQTQFWQLGTVGFGELGTHTTTWY